MPFSIRLDPDTEALIARLAGANRQTRAWVVREAVARYAADTHDSRSLYERIEPHVGRVKSRGDKRLSENTGRTFASIVRAKARARAR